MFASWHIQLKRPNVRLPKTHKIPPEIDVRVVKVSSKIWVLEQTQPTMLSPVSHMTIMSVIISVMKSGKSNDRKRLSQALVHFCDCSSKCVYGPKNVRCYHFAPNTSIMKTNLRTHIGQFSNRFQFLLLEVVVFQVKELELCTMVFFFVCPFATHFLGISFHVVRTMRPLLGEVSPALVFFQLLWQKFVIRTFSLHWSTIFSFALHSRWVHPKYTWSRYDVGSPRSTSFINVFHMGPIVYFRSAIFLSHPRIPIRIILVFSPNSVLFPVLTELLRTVFPKRGLQVGVRTDFVHKIFNVWPWFGPLVSWKA